MIVQFLRSIPVSDIPEPLRPHRALPALELGHGRKVPLVFRVLQKRNDAYPIKILLGFQTAELDQGRVDAEHIDRTVAPGSPRQSGNAKNEGDPGRFFPEGTLVPMILFPQVPAMIPPQHQRDVMQDGLLDRIGLDAGMIVPVHVAMQLEPQKVHLDQHVQAGAIDNVIRAEGLAHELEVILAFGQEIVAVIGHEKRAQAQLFHRQMGLVIAVLAAAYGNDAVIALGVAIIVDQLLEHGPALVPVDIHRLAGHTAARAHPVFIKGQRRG